MLVTEEVPGCSRRGGRTRAAGSEAQGQASAGTSAHTRALPGHTRAPALMCTPAGTCAAAGGRFPPHARRRTVCGGRQRAARGRPHPCGPRPASFGLRSRGCSGRAPGHSPATVRSPVRGWALRLRLQQLPRICSSLFTFICIDTCAIYKRQSSRVKVKFLPS